MNKLLPTLLLALLFFQLKAQQLPYNPAKEETRKGINMTRAERPGNAREAQEGIYGSPPSTKSVDIKGGNGTPTGWCIFNDVSDNVYVIGRYHNEIQLGATTLTGNPHTSYFLAKHDEEGNFISAINLIDGPDTKITIEQAEPFLSGFIISGTMENGTYDFGDLSIPADDPTAYIAYFNFDGTLNWIKTFDYNNYQPTPIAVKNDSIFASFGYPRVTVLNNSGDFLNEYFLSGAIIHDLAVHGDSLILGGRFYGEMMIDDVTLLSEATYEAAFVGSIAIADGSVNWAYEAAEDAQWQSKVNKIVVAEDNSLIVGGAVKNGVWWGNYGYGDEGGFVTHITAQGTIDSTFTQYGNYYGSNGVNMLLATQDSILFALGGSMEFGQTDYAFSEHFIRPLFSEEHSGIIEAGIYNNGKVYITGSLDNNMFLMTLTEAPLTINSTFTSQGNSGVFNIRSLEPGNNQSTFIFGEVTGQVELYGETIDNNEALILAKKNKDNQREWMKVIYNTEGSTGISNELAINTTDYSALIIGAVAGDVIIDGTTYPDIQDNFAAKFSESGNLEWIINVPMSECHTVSIDGDGSVYVSGSFTEPVELGGDIYSPSLGGSGYIAKYNAQGQFQWIKQLNADGAYLVNANANGQTISFSAEMEGSSVLFEGTEYPLGKDYGKNLFGSLTPDGTVNWAFIYGADAEPDDEYTYTEANCWANTINVDSNGNTYLSGFTGRSNIFGDTILYSPFQYNHFSLKADANGKVEWARIIKTNKRIAFNYNEAGLDEYGNYYIYGITSDSVEFSDGVKFKPSNDKGYGAYLAQVNAAGDLSWVYHFDAGSMNTSGVAVHGKNAVEIAGKASPYISLDQSYNTYYGSSFIIGFCDLEQASAPTGSVEVLNTDTTTYQVDASGSQINWTLEPSNAGVILDIGNEVRIAWDDTFTGEAKLSTTIDNFCGTSAASESLIINVKSLATGVDDEIVNVLQAFPNPVDGQLTLVIKNDELKKLDIAVYDLLGKKHLSLEEGNTNASISKTYNLSDLAKGTYILLIKDGQGSQSRLIFKQ